jgi:hypothetical protein
MGFGWFNIHFGRNDPNRYPDQWVFCSRLCQDAFGKLVKKTEGRMIDPTDMEIAAMKACLVPLGDYVGAIGMERATADYSRDEVLMLIEVVITAYQDRMIAEHEQQAAKDRAFLEGRLISQGKTSSSGGLI